MLNRGGESRCSHLNANSRKESIHSFIIKNNASCSFFCRGLFYKAEEVSFYSCFVESLIINSFCLLSNAFSVSIKIIMWARHPGM